VRFFELRTDIIDLVINCYAFPVLSKYTQLPGRSLVSIYNLLYTTDFISVMYTDFITVMYTTTIKQFP